MIALAEERGDIVFAPTHEACDIGNRAHVGSVFARTKYDGSGDIVPNALPDVIINCAGAVSGSIQDMVMTNGLGPHNLAQLGIRLVHMSTDCVYSGEEIRDDRFQPRLKVGDFPDPIDIYGRSKLLGEPEGKHVAIVRGSFIDPAGGFLHWLLNARGKIQAWEHAYWNGTTS